MMMDTCHLQHCTTVSAGPSDPASAAATGELSSVLIGIASFSSTLTTCAAPSRLASGQESRVKSIHKVPAGITPPVNVVSRSAALLAIPRDPHC
jgi:hypothetical protein